MISKICHFWERKIPSMEIKKGELESDLNVWFDAVQWIPDGYGEMIFQRFTRMETRPVNIPLKIQEVYRGFTASPKKSADFLIGMVMKNAEQNDMNYLESFYDLRYAIRRKEINIGPAMRWLRSAGFEVDVKKLQEPSAINFDHLREWLKNVCGRPREIQSDCRPEEDEIPF